MADFSQHIGRLARELEPLPEVDIRFLVSFLKPGFGASEWVTLAGEQRAYYFNLDQVYAHGTPQDTRSFHDLITTRLKCVAEISCPDEEPVLGYVCPRGGPKGAVQIRGAIAERVGWKSVVVDANQRLLRARVVSCNDTVNFPASVKWLAGRRTLLLADAATTGESLARASAAVRAFGMRPVAALVVFSREEGARQSLALVGVDVTALVTAEALTSDPQLGGLRPGRTEIRDFTSLMIEVA